MKQQKYSPWLIVFRVLFTLLTAVLIVFIFERSLQNGAISAQESQRMLLAMQRVLAKFTDRELSLHFVRKLAHFAEYTALGFLLQMCLRVYTRHYVKHISWPLLGGIAVALADETIQLYTPGRSSSVFVLASWYMRAREEIISVQHRAAPWRRQSRRKAASLTPAMGARHSRPSRATPPIFSIPAPAPPGSDHSPGSPDGERRR